MHEPPAARVTALPHVNTSSVTNTPHANGLTPAEFTRNKIIEEYLPCVGSVLAKVQRGLPAYVNADDLYSAGITGLIAAANRFDPAQAQTFRGYVCLRIRGAMLDELRRLDSCTRRHRSWNKKVQVAIQESEQVLGRAPTDQELSERLKISVTELARQRNSAKQVRIVSLDGDPENGPSMAQPLHELIADTNQEDVRETMETEEMKQLLMRRLAELPAIPKKILALYYFEGLRFSEIAEVFDLTESRICQLHKQAVTTLQAFIRSSALGLPPISNFNRTQTRSDGLKRSPSHRASEAKMKLSPPGIRVSGVTSAVGKNKR